MRPLEKNFKKNKTFFKLPLDFSIKQWYFN